MLVRTPLARSRRAHAHNAHRNSREKRGSQSHVRVMPATRRGCGTKPRCSACHRQFGTPPEARWHQRAEHNNESTLPEAAFLVLRTTPPRPVAPLLQKPPRCSNICGVHTIRRTSLGRSRSIHISPSTAQRCGQGGVAVCGALLRVLNGCGGCLWSCVPNAVHVCRQDPTRHAQLP